MKALAIVLVLFCTGCVGQWLPEVSIDHQDLDKLATAATNSCKAADLDGNGITEGRAESTAFWNNILSAASAFVATAPEGADPEGSGR